MSDSQITLHKHGAISFTGEDATNLYRAVTLKSALGLIKVGLKPTRGVGKKQLLEMAAKYTGKIYKSKDVDAAIKDVGTWIEAMKAAMPVSDERE